MPDAAGSGRTVSIVLDEDGALRELESFHVASPWWSDVAPITSALPGLAVLRLLSVTGAHRASAGGHVHYLAEWLEAPHTTRRARPSTRWSGALDDEPFRQPWARPGGPAADLAWVRAHLGPLVGAAQQRTWNLSAIWRVEAASTTAWLKCVPTFASHEPAVLRALAGHPVPRLLASDGHRELLEPLPGRDGYEATLEETRSLVDVLVGIQRWSIDEADRLEAAGVPDRRLGVLVERATDLVERCLPNDPHLARLLETADARVAAIDACGLPDVLVHGDAHPGNARIGEGAGRGIWFDWGDARIGHPLIDVAVTEWPTPHRDALVAHWLDAWRDAVPGSAPHRAWPLIRPLAALGDAVVYQGFLDQIEPSERRYHEDDVLPCLRRAAALAAAEHMS